GENMAHVRGQSQRPSVKGIGYREAAPTDQEGIEEVEQLETALVFDVSPLISREVCRLDVSIDAKAKAKRMHPARGVRLLRSMQVVHPGGEIVPGEVARGHVRAFSEIRVVGKHVNGAPGAGHDISDRPKLDEPIDRHVPGGRAVEEHMPFELLYELVLTLDS